MTGEDFRYNLNFFSSIFTSGSMFQSDRTTGKKIDLFFHETDPEYRWFQNRGDT